MMAEHDGEVKIIAGGTDLLPSMKQKLFTPAYVLDLRGVAELRGIRELPGDGVEIGALEHAQHGRALGSHSKRIPRPA